MSDVDTWMEIALVEARAAEAEGEVPVGAVVIHEGRIVGRGHNVTAHSADPCGHAEIVALRAAGRILGDWRLEGATLVVTLEPCPMCIGAIILARVQRLVYAAADPRYGACGSAVNLATPKLAPHLLQVEAGHRAEECGELLRGFFRGLRARES